MKILILTAVSITLALWCASCNDNKNIIVNSENYHEIKKEYIKEHDILIKHIKIYNHTYILTVYRYHCNGAYAGMVHNPDCKCKKGKIKYEIKNK